MTRCRRGLAGLPLIRSGPATTGGSGASPSRPEATPATRHATSPGTRASSARAHAAAPAAASRHADARLWGGRAAARRGRGAGVHEQPFVVPASRRLHARGERARPRVDAYRRLAALADDAVQPATGGGEGTRRWGRLRSTPAAWHPGRIHTREQQLELAVLGHRVLVLLAQETLIDEHIDVGGTGARSVAAFPQADGTHVLLAAEDELGLLLPLRLVPPGGQHGAHQHGHDRQRHQQGRHGVAALIVLTP
jgi:hypothetical protein